MLILGQKSSILGPTIFKIQQPNWHYCLDAFKNVLQLRGVLLMMRSQNLILHTYTNIVLEKNKS